MAYVVWHILENPTVSFADSMQLLDWAHELGYGAQWAKQTELDTCEHGVWAKFSKYQTWDQLCFVPQQPSAPTTVVGVKRSRHERAPKRAGGSGTSTRPLSPGADENGLPAPLLGAHVPHAISGSPQAQNMAANVDDTT